VGKKSSAVYNINYHIVWCPKFRKPILVGRVKEFVDVLEEKRPKIICMDELDKMPRQFQEKLLNFMESGHIKVDQMRKQYDFKIKGAKVFAVDRNGRW
jgi:MoxR-like ATPase